MEHIHFVTGKLAEPMLRRVLEQLAAEEPANERGFSYSVQVLPITVAALMTTKWIARHLRVPPQATRVILPGYVTGEMGELPPHDRCTMELGPRDVHQLPTFLGREHESTSYGDWSIEIVAEINHAPRWDPHDLVQEAARLREAGADIIDVGCEPGGGWHEVGDCVRRLRDAGFRVSIDSLDRTEIEAAVRSGAELVLSVQASNREFAPDWGCEVVVIPDDPDDLDSLHATVAFLADRNVSMRLDPILEPIGLGFAPSLGRYLAVRETYPDAEMLMGIGNLSEMTEVDSAGVNLLLLGFCQELGIRSVLTTEVINWARTSVAECDIARRLVHFAVQHQAPPKHVDPRLVMLRDPERSTVEPAALDQLASSLRDHHVRLFADEQQLHMVFRGEHLAGTDPMALFASFLQHYPRELDPSHAFYLGYELAKAATAQTLGKRYEQDVALDWGFLTRPESRHRSEPKSEPPEPPSR